MTGRLKGKTKSQAQELFAQFQRLVTNQTSEADEEANLGKLVVFSGVCEFPVRVKCPILAWHAMMSALDQKKDTVSTEKSPHRVAMRDTARPGNALGFLQAVQLKGAL